MMMMANSQKRLVFTFKIFNLLALYIEYSNKY